MIGVVPVALRVTEYDSSTLPSGRLIPPSGRLVVMIVGAITFPLMVSVRVFDTLPAVFFAVIFTLYVPAEAGVPVIFPALEHDSPEGSPVADHEIGVVPVALSVAEYDVPTVPSARLEVMIDGIVAEAVIVTVNDFVAVLPLASLTFREKLYVPAFVGVPLRYRLLPEGLMLRPSGNVPLCFVHVYDDFPPLTVT